VKPGVRAVFEHAQALSKRKERLQLKLNYFNLKPPGDGKKMPFTGMAWLGY